MPLLVSGRCSTTVIGSPPQGRLRAVALRHARAAGVIDRRAGQGGRQRPRETGRRIVGDRVVDPLAAPLRRHKPRLAEHLEVVAQDVRGHLGDGFDLARTARTCGGKGRENAPARGLGGSCRGDPRMRTRFRVPNGAMSFRSPSKCTAFLGGSERDQSQCTAASAQCTPATGACDRHIAARQF